MAPEKQGEIKRLEAEAAQHENTAAIVRGSMSPTPSPDDYQLAELAQREADRATDKRALANHIVNERIKKLTHYFQERSGCTVSHDWNIDSQSHRFYFRSEKETSWRYILDVFQGDVEEQDVSEIIQHLDAAKWQRVLGNYAGKRIPLFKDKRFSDPAAFREWPRKAPAK
jgi:hypothetical protein